MAPAPSATPRAALVSVRPGAIVLARHGEPALSRKCYLTSDQYRDWWARYEVGGLRAQDGREVENLVADDGAVGRRTVLQEADEFHEGLSFK